MVEVTTTVRSSGLPADAFCSTCPTRELLGRLAGKWTVLVIDALYEGTMRFSELRRRLEGVSQKMLTETLRSLERDGFVTRKVYASVPPKVEYTLTPLGASLREPVAALRLWSEHHINDVERAQARHDARARARVTE